MYQRAGWSASYLDPAIGAQAGCNSKADCALVRSQKVHGARTVLFIETRQIR